jgi:uncharacterized membrane protein YvbJ
MAKCESCGSELSEGSKFCSKCGAPVGVKEEFSVRSEDQLQNAQSLSLGKKLRTEAET